MDTSERIWEGEKENKLEGRKKRRMEEIDPNISNQKSNQNTTGTRRAPSSMEHSPTDFVGLSFVRRTHVLSVESHPSLLGPQP